MAEGRTFQHEDSMPSKKRKLRLDEISEESTDKDNKKRRLMFDEIYEESINSDMIEQEEKDNSQAFCDRCFIMEYIKVIALYMCVVCEKYVCEVCFNRHDNPCKSHTVIRVKSESGENDGFDDFVSSMMNESKKERKESLRKTNVCVCDYVDTKHGLVKDKDCDIRGITGYANKWWVLCDYDNYCIKLFSLGSNVLQRYIRLGSKPWDVTEIIVKNKTTEQDSASCSETDISETDNKPDRKHLLAVTFLGECFILIIDLGKNPAVIHSKIKTEKECLQIDFYDGNLYTACKELSRYSVSILSVEGVTLKTFQTDIPGSWHHYWPSLTVLNGNIYMTDYYNHRVVCYNDEGRILHEIRIDLSFTQGICVDRSEDKVYVSSYWHDKVYELESDLSRYTSVIDQTKRYMKRPWAICFYSDKLYVSHYPWSVSGFYVTVVRLL